MKNLISGIKTAGVVATAAMTLNSCEQKNTTNNDVQEAMYKVDSVANIRPEYKNTINAIALYKAQIQVYKDANKNMLKCYAQDYIKRNIKDVRLRKFLSLAMDEQILMEVSGFDMNESVYDFIDLDSCYVAKMRFFRRNQRWYDDLVVYLVDGYTEKQLLNSDFFKTINNPEMKQTFEYNTKQIERLKSVVDAASKRENRIYDDLWQQYVNHNQKVR